MINLSKYGIINCHAGKLPEYRGGSPLNWQLINNENKFGISVIKINTKIDAGDIIEEKKFDLKKSYNIKNLHKIANKNFPILIFNALKKIFNKSNLKKQNLKKVHYYRQRKPEDSFLNFKKMNFSQIDCFVRALQKPYPNSFFIYKNYRYNIIKIVKSKIKLNPGEIIIKNKKIYMGCKRNTINVIKYKKLRC